MLRKFPEKLHQSLAAYIDAHYVGFEKFAVPAAAKRTACVAAPRREEVCNVRACRPMGSSWKKQVDADYQSRKK